VTFDPPDHDLARIGIQRKKEESAFYRGEGRPSCDGTGYRGRTAVYEILPFTQQIRDLVVASASETDIRQQAIASGMTTLARWAPGSSCAPDAAIPCSPHAAPARRWFPRSGNSALTAGTTS
jgi:hypothetical protein